MDGIVPFMLAADKKEKMPSPQEPIILPIKIAPNPEKFRMMSNAMYYPNWLVADGQTPSSISFKYASHAVYCFAHVNEQGYVYLSNEEIDRYMIIDGQQGAIRALAQHRTNNKGMKVVLSIGGSSEQADIFSRIVLSRECLENFALSAKALLDEFDLNGIDIDWKFPQGIEQGHGFYNLLGMMRTQLERPQNVLTATIAGDIWCLKDLNLAMISGLVDGLNVVAYDFVGPWHHSSGNHAPLYNEFEYRTLEGEMTDTITPEMCGASGNSIVRYLIDQGATPHKILLGIPVFGRSFVGADGPHKQYQYPGGIDGCFEYKDLPRPNTREITDANLVAGRCVGGDGGYVTYDTVESVRRKAKYAQENGLAGLYYWHVGSDKPGKRSLVKAGFFALHGLDF